MKNQKELLIVQQAVLKRVVTALISTLSAMIVGFGELPTVENSLTTSPANPPAASANTAAEPPQSTDLHAAQTATQKYFRSLDDTLKPEVAASLAGLALAAAAFLLPFTIRSELAGGKQPQHAALAIKYFVHAFNAFIAIVVADLLLDPARFIGKEWIDGAANLAGGAAGVRYLFQGANSIRYALKKDSTQAFGHALQRRQSSSQ